MQIAGVGQAVATIMQLCGIEVSKGVWTLASDQRNTATGTTHDQWLRMFTPGPARGNLATAEIDHHVSLQRRPGL